MEPSIIKKEFSEAREKVFSDESLIKDSFNFCITYSLLVEEYIQKIFDKEKFDFALVSAGSFCRRELSPYSDIDIFFIAPDVNSVNDSIKYAVTKLWDSGIEISHTVRSFDDINILLKDDLQSITQFFETRFLLGNKKTYEEWNKKVFESITDKMQVEIINLFLEDINLRYDKFGQSAKILEPNVKMSAGGLRDLHSVEWMYALKNKLILTSQEEITQTENFTRVLEANNISSEKERIRIIDSYRFILGIRNRLHLIKRQKVDRLEFYLQAELSKFIYAGDETKTLDLMKKYFESANTIHRFSKTMLRKFDEEISKPLPSSLKDDFDQDFNIIGNKITTSTKRLLNLSEILRAFYYRALSPHSQFDENLRTLVIESIHELEETKKRDAESSVFFREIIRLPRNVGDSLFNMNELGVLSAFLPEYKELNGFFQPGVYHCYTADEHTLIAIKNIESLYGKTTHLGKIFNSLKEKDLLVLAILFHDVAKPISVPGHEIIGAEMTSSLMSRLGYDEKEISFVSFLVKNHLIMEQIAFRRNLNDPATLNNFVSSFSSVKELDFLYLLTYADLSAVNPAVWTEWKSDLLYELYRKTRAMIEDQISGEELLFNETFSTIDEKFQTSSAVIKDHLNSFNDMSYLQHFTKQEINEHIEEILKGEKLSALFKNVKDFTNVTIITKDTNSLLSKLCGVFAINDLNIHDAKIFTRKDKIIIDSFNLTGFRTKKPIEEELFDKIKNDLFSVLNNELDINLLFEKHKQKWKRLETKFFRRKSKIKIEFEEHDKYTIIDVFSPDRIGLLYQITSKLAELGISIYFAKISTKADDIVDSFYTLNRNGNKLTGSEYELIVLELTEAIKQIL